jgi:hypothetical protein
MVIGLVFCPMYGGTRPHRGRGNLWNKTVVKHAVFAEFLGASFLLVAVVGSGIMAKPWRMEILLWRFWPMPLQQAVCCIASLPYLARYSGAHQVVNRGM